MEEKQYARVGERVIQAQLDNGLRIYVALKPGFQSSI